MFIELTDHLRCPRPHAESFLVLLPDVMIGRRVRAGHLGCPVCQWGVAWNDSVPDFGGGWRAEGAPHVDADQAYALLGLDGPGGWVALGGQAGALADGLAERLPGVSFVAVNAPPQVASAGSVSIVLSGVWPVKAHAMRGIVLGADADLWRDAAIASALPGLRVVGAGEPPGGEAVELLASVPDVWVAKKR